MRRQAAVLALVVVLAGCTPAAPGDLRDTPTGDTASPTATVDPDNPWREAELEVAIRTGAGDDRAYGPLVEQALSFWTGNGERYAGYPVGMRLVDDEADADLVVSFVDAIDDCGNVTDVAGCAPMPTRPAHVDRPELVRVKTGLSDASTVLVTKHELGHALGLGHDDEPADVMAATANLTTLPQPDATERVVPWRDPELSVYVEYGNASDAGVRDQVGHALDYVTGGADGFVPSNVTLVETRNRSAADVVVRFRDTACGDSSGSCAQRFGPDPDRDGALEYYSRVEVTLADIDTAATAWHVAYWLGYAVGFDAEEDWPPVLRDASYEERRSDWWE